MHRYLKVDGYFVGTGIRDDSLAGGWIDLNELALSSALKEKIEKWILRYGDEHYSGYLDKQNIERLDFEGKEVARMVKQELVDVKVIYYSAAKNISEII